MRTLIEQCVRWRTSLAWAAPFVCRLCGQWEAVVMVLASRPPNTHKHTHTHTQFLSARVHISPGLESASRASQHSSLPFWCRVGGRGGGFHLCDVYPSTIALISAGLSRFSVGGSLWDNFPTSPVGYFSVSLKYQNAFYPLYVARVEGRKSSIRLFTELIMFWHRTDNSIVNDESTY